MERGSRRNERGPVVTISRVVDGLTELRLIGADTPRTFSARVREATDVDALGA